MSDKEPRQLSNFVERRRSIRPHQQAPLDIDEPKNGVLIPLRFETSNLPQMHQHLAWQEWMTAIVDSRLPNDVRPEDGFNVQQAIWNLGRLLIVQQTLPAFGYERSADKVRLSPLDHWQITLLRAGHTWNEAGGNVAQNEPGMMEIRSLGQPFRGRQSATDSISIIAPVDLFADRGGLPAASSNIVFGGHRARLLIDHLSSVEANLDCFTAEDLPGVGERLRELIFNAITPLINRGAGNDSNLQVGLMTKARRFISNNIGSPSLTVETLCRELAISRTKLYELFENSGGVASYIRRRRLISAHAILADGTDNRKIAEVGLSLSFDSPANFSRAFTQQFGYSPSYVYKHIANQKTPHGPIEEDILIPRTFEKMLRTLGLF